MNYEKEPLHISTSVPNGTYEVTVTVTAHEDIVFSILSQSRRFMAQDINGRTKMRSLLSKSSGQFLVFISIVIYIYSRSNYGEIL